MVLMNFLMNHWKQLLSVRILVQTMLLVSVVARPIFDNVDKDRRVKVVAEGSENSLRKLQQKKWKKKIVKN